MADLPKGDSSKSKVTNLEVKHSTRWLAFTHITYTDPEGQERGWDMVNRTSRKEGASADAVTIFAILKKSGEEDKTILVRQFRPPMDKETIELPAGLIDGTEPAESAALRELKEETGYVGKVVAVGPPACMSPGLTNETVQVVSVSVDLDAEENQNPKQELEESEFITRIIVPVKGLRKRLDELSDQGYVVFCGLYNLAMGMEMAGV